MSTHQRSHKPIIVCDDDADVREIVAVILQQAGYTVLAASGYSDLMYFMENVHPCLILLDIRMPEWDGFFVAESLRKRGCNVPIIFITAHDNRFSRVYAPALGSVGFFTKPLDQELLLQRIETILEAPSAGVPNCKNPIQ